MERQRRDLTSSKARTDGCRVPLREKKDVIGHLSRRQLAGRVTSGAKCAFTPDGMVGRSDYSPLRVNRRLAARSASEWTPPAMSTNGNSEGFDLPGGDKLLDRGSLRDTFGLQAFPMSPPPMGSVPWRK